MNPMHRKLNQPVGDKPSLGTRPGLRARLILEEAAETVGALAAGDMTEIVDGLCDLLYVTFGTAVDEVRANLPAANGCECHPGGFAS